LAILTPFLAFLFLITIDFGRVFFHAITVQNAARKGALYGSLDAAHAVDTSGIQAAALADATDLTPTPNVTSTTTVDASGNLVVQVTVTDTFKTISNYPGIPRTADLTRTVQMRVLP
jgi:Flp pilus assembly protein TadG